MKLAQMKIQNWRLKIFMKPSSQKHVIEFKHVTGQDMLEEVKQLFLEYTH